VNVIDNCSVPVSFNLPTYVFWLIFPFMAARASRVLGPQVQRSHISPAVTMPPNRWTGRSISWALTVFLHGRVMIVGVGIDWQHHCGQCEHYTLQSSPFLPSPSLSLPLVVTFQKCKHLPLEGSDNLHLLAVPTCYKKMISPSYLQYMPPLGWCSIWVDFTKWQGLKHSRAFSIHI
jgi:hypothetical protein